MKIVIDDGIPFIKGVFDHIAHVVYLSGSLIARSDLQDADALIVRTRTRCNETLLAGTSVTVICSATISYDHIDTNFCAQAGIKWFTVPGCNANSVAQYFLASLAVLHQRSPMNFSELTLGVVGYGNVGKRIVHYGRLLGFKVLVNDPPLSYADESTDFTEWDSLVRRSDILTFHTPLTRSGDYPTYQFVNGQSLQGCNKKVVLINTSRGEVWNELDIQALKREGKIGQTIMDVWANEPNINQILLKDNLLSTSHIAGYSADGKYNGTVGCVEHICREFALESLSGKVHQPLAPEVVSYTIECHGRSTEDIFSQVILKSYDIERDSRLLKLHSADFEDLRNHYPNRREFGAFTLKLDHSDDNTRILFAQMGFNIVQ